MIPVARLGDRTIGVCNCHDSPITVGGTIVTASIDEYTNDLGTARLTDIVLADCGHTGTIVTASELTYVNNLGVARIGDQTTGCYVATIITGSPDRFTL